MHDDAAFYLQMAELNVAEGETRAALAALESAVDRGLRSADVERARALIARLPRDAHNQTRIGGLLERLSHGGSQKDPAQGLSDAKPQALGGSHAPGRGPAENLLLSTSSGQTLDAIRRLLISPDMLHRLKSALGDVGGGPAPQLKPRADELSLPVAQLLGTLLEADLDLAATAELALGLVVRATGATHGHLLLEGQEPWSFGLGASAQLPPASRGILTEVRAKQQAVLVEDGQSDPRFALRESVQARGVRAVLCVPVTAAGRWVGFVYLEARTAARFGQAEVELAEVMASVLGPTLERAQAFARQGRTLERQAARLARQQPRLLGRSRPVEDLRRTIERVAAGNHTVLIVGESGSGKELVAQALHAASLRAGGPFLAENMGALAESVVEAELFGHAQGAFTGATQSRPGLFQLAHGGTLLLDEVGEMTLEVQRKLLRVLEQREVRPVGSSASVSVDVRVLAATHRDLAAEVRAGRFREDLYYRLNVVPLFVPPLRSRGDDMNLLLEHFIAEAAAELQRSPPALPAELLQKLRSYPWPGNVRELRGYAQRFVLSGEAAALIGIERSPGSASTGPLRLDVGLGEGQVLSLREARAAFDRAYLEQVLARYEHNISAAAEALGLSRSYLSELLKRMGLKRKR